MAKFDVEVRLCQYTRIGTESRWEPIDNGEYLSEVQKEFEELKAKFDQAEAEVVRLNNIIWGMQVEIENDAYFYFEGYVAKNLLPVLKEKPNNKEG